VLFVLAAIATLTREIIKDVEDLEGDREEGLRTLPIAIGERRALAIAVLLLVAAVVASPMPYLREEFGVAYLLVVVPADAIMLVAAYESFEDPTAGQSHLKYGMFSPQWRLSSVVLPSRCHCRYSGDCTGIARSEVDDSPDMWDD